MPTPPWWNRLQTLAQRARELEEQLAQPRVIADRAAFQRYSKELADITPVVHRFREYCEIQQHLREARTLSEPSQDDGLAQLARDEVTQLTARQTALTADIETLLLQQAAGSHRRIIVEIRAGTGGEEAALFAADLYRMYSKYLARLGLRIEPIDHHPTELGGYREVIFAIDSPQAFQRLRFESGVHRVQRVPTTEASGRIHTSAVTVAVLPEPDDVELALNPADLKVDVFRSSGPGGQSVNTTDSAVRVTHIPTGVVVQCQDERSQLRNKEKALRVLRARLLAHCEEKARAQHARDRKTQVGSGDRSEKIRTYNFPDHRLTDHRVNLTLHQLDAIMDGELDELMAALEAAERHRLLQ